MASPNFMRLSLMKAALADDGWSSVQEIRASRSFFARCGIPRTSNVRDGVPHVRQRLRGVEKDEATRISCGAALDTDSRDAALS